MEFNPHTDYIREAAVALEGELRRHPDRVTLHTNARPLRAIYTAELAYQSIRAPHWHGELRVCWHSARGWYAAGEQRGPGRHLGVVIFAEPKDVAANLRHVITYGPHSETPPRHGIWHRAGEIDLDHAAFDLDHFD